ncbi:peptidase domain-containing ABC transporter [Phormidium pseudopriestleyi FRX01]|uniref:Peptidase domain-containing ABC transporter n=1 Tax=Phormidium pseudopriestleyi FRX01 TaxID=1759528 RepID=A0ABS3FPX4_9CYAN|nr:peptidase domain-containing ABC transporter [Phormidium pseudopriestleyi]MBO0348671.1 peptidase domain-containing ABC transporter [Phormidium pseudopriestleyi FRX01]
MTSTIDISQISEFLAKTAPFNRLSDRALENLATHCELLRYRTGQPIFELGKMPTQVAVIYEGQVRELAHDQRSQSMVSLRLAGPGEILGWGSLIRGVAVDSAIASREVICVCIRASTFLEQVKSENVFREAFEQQAALNEVFELLSGELQRRADATTNAKDLTLQFQPQAVVINIPKGKANLTELDRDHLWFLSSGTIGELDRGSRLMVDANTIGKLPCPTGARVIGLPLFDLAGTQVNPQDNGGAIADSHHAIAPTTPITPTVVDPIPYAPDRPPVMEAEENTPRGKVKYPFMRGRGPIQGSLACFQMLGKQYQIRVRRDVVQRVLENQYNSHGKLTLQSCGSVAAMMGFNGQLVTVPVEVISRLKAPAMIRWENSFALLFSVSDREIVAAIPSKGIIRRKPQKFLQEWQLVTPTEEGKEGTEQVLLLVPPPEDKQDTFNFWWFLPELGKYKSVLVQVFLASFFVQLFGLANPLITQVIIDKVIGQRSLETLDILGILMVLVAVFEGALTWLRTYLFVDTTNRIDLNLGSQVIDHLLRLPLGYFDQRRVGELAGRVSELEKIRQFLTGTALTVVLDALFSVIYIAVMLSYSLLMTAVALAVVPFMALLIAGVSPIVQRLLRKRAECYADTQSYLVEVLSGIQTVKAQNIELTSRWSWYDRYARYISAGFKTVVTSTTASSISTLLNKGSGLALLWVGAHLVLSDPPQMSLGQLIAFRIIASNVTGSLLRFVQVWQTFQETAMSVERLRDILEAHPEADEKDRSNIPMPAVEGVVRFENVSFHFPQSKSLQLANINLEFQTGQFVGIVGQSGSGKSTLMKLLQRLYEPTGGRILLDGYDVSKVELYSLRSQIGVVLQDTLLFNGTVQENIALTNPDATTDDIINSAKIGVAHEFIMTLPNGYNSIVGERGASLSGGQRQRIAIARTVLQNPHLLILDEATSALDYNSERLVCENLAEAFKGRTVFFITHRLTTVKKADVILMMDQGAVVEQGTHDELMALKGLYYCLYQQQESQV